MHVIPPREDPRLLERLRAPKVLVRTRELPRSKDKGERQWAILCIERIRYVMRGQGTADLLLRHADLSKDKYEVGLIVAIGLVLGEP